MTLAHLVREAEQPEAKGSARCKRAQHWACWGHMGMRGASTYCDCACHDWQELERQRLMQHPETPRVSWTCHHAAKGESDRPYLRTRDASKGHAPAESTRVIHPWRLTR